LGLDGGLEGTAIVDATFGASAPSAGNGKWTTAGSSATQSAIAVETGTVRSGAKSLKISGTNTSLARVWTPAFTIPSTSSKFFVQYYRRSASTTNTQTAQIGVIRGGTEQLNGTYTLVSAINTWEKVTYAPGAVTTVTSVAGVIGNKSNNATGGDVFIDDFVIYADVAVDNAAPNSPGTVTATPNGPNPTTKLDVSWLAASGGVDNGGYMVVRYTTSPASSDDPNVNGIYATNNTISGTVTGTVVYVGTSLSFTDNSLSPGATYYYKVYTYDKAYNYSAETNGSGTTTSGTAATQLVITAINGGSTVTADSGSGWFQPSCKCNSKYRFFTLISYWHG